MNSPTSDAQDALDMARLAQGHDAALNDLMDRHATRLFHYLVRALQDESDAADCAQETFTRVYHYRTRFDPRQKFNTWLYAIASNLVRDRYRWRARHPQTSLNAEPQGTETGWKENIAGEGPAPDQALQSQECAEAVRRAVAALPEDLRQPLILAVYEGRSQAEIGTILKCSAKAVETRIYRARQQLRQVLEKMLRTN